MLEFYFSVCYCEIPVSVGVFDNKVMLINSIKSPADQQSQEGRYIAGSSTEKCW